VTATREQPARDQLALIAEIADALSEARVAWWLFGGWAMDFRAGRVTREHSDIEAFVWKSDAGSVRAALERRGFFAPPGGLYPEEAMTFLKDRYEVGFWYLVRDDAGRIVTPGRWADWPWIAGAFDAPPGTLDGVTAPVISVEALLDMKENFSKHPHGAPPREKDLRDIALLRHLLEPR
jgi:hypothetical protein